MRVLASLSVLAMLATSALADEPGKLPYSVQVRGIEHKTEVLKQEAWELNARLNALKEKLLGERGETRATIVHRNDLSGQFRLLSVQYALDGHAIGGRDDAGLADAKSFEVWSGPVAPGSHLVSVNMLLRGNGYNLFTYLRHYRFPVRSSTSFLAGEGRHTELVVSARERGDLTTPLAKRPDVGFTLVVDPAAGP